MTRVCGRGNAGRVRRKAAQRSLSYLTSPLSPHSSLLSLMLPCSLLALYLIHGLASAQVVQQSTSTTSGPLLLPTGGPDHGLDLGHIGTTIGGRGIPCSVLIQRVQVLTLRIQTRRLRWSHRCGYNRTWIWDDSLVTETTLLVPQQRAGRDRAVLKIPEAQRRR
jgi:hypothetical protein